MRKKDVFIDSHQLWIFSTLVLFILILGGCTHTINNALPTSTEVSQEEPEEIQSDNNTAEQPDTSTDNALQIMLDKESKQPSIVSDENRDSDISEESSDSDTPGDVKHSNIIILISSKRINFTSVAESIKKQVSKTKASTYLLTNDDEVNDELLEEIQSSSTNDIVAIGLKAALFAKDLKNKNVVFCQIFNFSDHSLTSAKMKGVDFVVPLSTHVKELKRITPELRTVGVITGADKEYLIDNSKTSAEEMGVELIHLVTNSDLETLFKFKKIAHTLDALLLLPDNRILSRRVILEVMKYSNKHDIKVVAHTPELLKFGAVLSISNDPNNVADMVLEQVSRMNRGDAVDNDDVLQLTKGISSFNDGVKTKTLSISNSDVK